jgi:hypothetical protein
MRRLNLTHLGFGFGSRQGDSRPLSLAQPVALAADHGNVGMMQQPIEHRRRHGCVAREGRIPLRKGNVAGDNDGTALVPLSDRLKEVTGLLA